MSLQNNISGPTVSVIMSVYNEPIDWIQQAVDSILNQTFTDFEFIIVNDKPDREENKTLLSELSEKDRRIRVLHNSDNFGLATSLNRGILTAKGRYIARMDADDVSLSERFQKQVSYLDSHPKVGVLGTLVQTINSNNVLGKKLNLRLKNKDLKNSLLFLSPFVHPTVMIRKEVLKNNLYDINCRVGQDWELWSRLSRITDFRNLSDILLYYRIHSDQSTIKAGKNRTVSSTKYKTEKLCDIYHITGEFRTILCDYMIGESLSRTDLDKLFLCLIDNEYLQSSYVTIIGIYLRQLKKYGYRNLIYNKVFYKYPLKYIISSISLASDLIKISL